MVARMVFLFYGLMVVSGRLLRLTYPTLQQLVHLVICLECVNLPYRAPFPVAVSRFPKAAVVFGRKSEAVSDEREEAKVLTRKRTAVW